MSPVLLLLVGCLLNPALYEERKGELADEDGDGTMAETDCNDLDANVFPGAPEACDGADNDCDGAVDEDASDVLIWYVDADADTFGSATRTSEACEQPTGFVATATDCDDTDPERFPGGTEVPYDGTDQDCDGEDLVDVDGDGAAATRSGGADCNDEDPAVGPHAAETCLDDVDQDCDGADLTDCDLDGVVGVESGGTDCDDSDAAVYPGAAEGWHDLGTDNDCDETLDDPVDVDLAEADVRIVPPSTGGYAGHRVGSLPDVDGDGVNELFVAAPYDRGGGSYAGAVYVVLGGDVPASGGQVEVDAVGSILQGSAATGLLGLSVSAGEVEGQAVAHVLAFGDDDGTGAVWAFGPDVLGATGVHSTASEGLELVHGAAGAGQFVTTIGDEDFDGDGVVDLLVSSFESGAVYGFSAPEATTHSVDDADWVFLPSANGGALEPMRAGDVDGDGVGDLALSDAEADLTVGVVWLAGGAALVGGEFGDDAILQLIGASVVRPVQTLPSGDRAIFSARYNVAIYLNPTLGSTLDPRVYNDYDFFSETSLGDVSALTDIATLGTAGPGFVLGGPNSFDASERGRCAVWQSNEFQKTIVGTDVQLHFTGERPGDRACTSIDLVDDVNGDGNVDLAIGAPGNDEVGPEAGVAYLQFAP